MKVLKWEKDFSLGMWKPVREYEVVAETESAICIKEWGTLRDINKWYPKQGFGVRFEKVKSQENEDE